MKASKLLLYVLLAIGLASSAPAGEAVDRLLTAYSSIETVTCQIRRTKKGELGKMTFLSRVYWTNKNQLHAEGIAPIKRRTIVDGERLWQYVEGDPKGFSRPVEDLSDQMTISMKLVPGTAMDHLLHLKDLEETALPNEKDSETRIGIQADNKYVVLKLDDHGRLTTLQFYKTGEQKNLTAEYRYRDFKEVLPGAWVPLTHETEVQSEKMSFSETVKVDRLIVNDPIAASLFIASSFFDKSIDFVDEFAKIFPE